MRGDGRELRARLVLSLLRRRCPLEGPPTRSWYVPGAVARLGAAGLRRAWSEDWRAEPPSSRRLGDHLRRLEAVLALVRQPGEWLPTFAELEPGRRPRYPDTVHVLESEQDAAWWASVGRDLLARHPEARRSPAAWRAVVGSWRARAPRQGLLFVDQVAGALDARRPPAGERDELEAAGRLVALVRRPPSSPAELLAGLQAAGAGLVGAERFRLAGDGERLLGAAALLALALRRGAPVRSRSGWLVAAARRTTAPERRAAVRRVLEAG